MACKRASHRAFWDAGHSVGTCRSCLAFGEILQARDGSMKCPRCALQRRRLFLPLPKLVVVKCLSAMLPMAAGAYLLVLALSRGRMLYAVGAFLLGSIGLLVLARICLTVVYCVEPTRTRPPRAAQNRRPPRQS